MKNHRKTECLVCGDKILNSHEQQTCRRFSCRRKFDVELKRIQKEELFDRQLFIAEHERSEKARDLQLDNDVDNWTPVVTPANTLPLTRLPRRRRYRFMKRLLRLIQVDQKQGVDQDQIQVVEPEIGLPILGDTCANCKGSCCQNGGTAAYIDQRVVRRFVDAHPDRSPLEMLNLYCGYLPEKTYSGSCVFHSEKGCALPRELRSNTCNRMVCAGFSEIRNRATLDGEGQFFVVAMKGESVIRSCFVESVESDCRCV